MDEKRIIELESKVAFQEHSLHQMQELVAVQQKQLYDLEELCRLLLQKINSQPSATGGGEVNNNERPPHY
ncbi:MAG: SlyX family protein [Desulfuromonas sp.]|nr:SlyX family protein [Desulfuromonas sp.]